MYIKERDKEILAFVLEYGSITIGICSKIHFRNVKYNYYQARRRLSQLFQAKLLKKTKNPATNEVIYYNSKPLTAHNLHILNVYAELIYQGVDILNFEREKKFLEGKYSVDGFIEFTTPLADGRKQHHAVLYEVDLTHKSEYDRTVEIYESYEMQMYFREEYNTDKDKFPVFLICSAKVPSKPKYHDEFKIKYIDFGLQDLMIKAIT